MYIAAGTALLAALAYGLLVVRQRRRSTASFASIGLILLGLAPFFGIFTALGIYWEVENVMALVGTLYVLLGIPGLIFASVLRLNIPSD
jgi:hypothetical protein